MSKILPKEITKCDDLHLASFSYSNGIQEAKSRGLKQGDGMNNFSDNGIFLVCCGDVMIKVRADEYPEIQRRII